jgi:hypothetical protein
MATKVIFNGKTIKQPGSYATTKSGIKNPPLALSFGNVLMIDTGSGAGFGQGSGISGTIESAKSAIYSTDNLRDFRDAVKGGPMWRLADPLFRPAGSGIAGASTVYVVKAAATVPAEVTSTFTGGGSNGGSITIQARDEGLVGNGIEGGETKAVGSFDVATAVSSDVFDVQVNEGSGAASIGSYTVTGSDTTTTTATKIAVAINAHAKGYSATSSGTKVTVTARASIGLADATEFNAYPLTIAITGTSTTSNLVSFTGGVAGTKITQGYSITIEAGKIDTSKFIMKFNQGSFTGIDPDGDPYSGIEIVDASPILIAESVEFDNIQTLIDWMGTDFTFGAFFKLKTSTKTGTGLINAADLASNAGNNKFGGGTEEYNSTHLQKVLDNIATLDFTFILSDQGGANAQSADNTTILTHITDEARYEKFLVIGGGDTQNEFASQSIATAKYWNNDRVIVVHGGPKISSTLSSTGFKEYTASYKAAGVLGRIAGLQPQIPATFKNLNIQGERHELNNKEVDEALDAGLLTTRFDTELSTFAIVQGINTLQKNDYMVNSDATSHSIAIRRIAAQLNKEIVVNAKTQLLGDPNGPNRNTVSALTLKEWLGAYLGRRTASATTDNLILGFNDISVETQGDSFFINYAFIPNFPVNKLFFTGFIIDPS